jgi:Ca2+-binding EF-hand superfamily protein
MKQKGINSEKIFINNVLKNLEEMGSLPDNKIIFIESIINLFNIEDKDDKGLIMDFADKEFVDGKRLLDIKNNEISIFDTLFNKNDKILKNSKELKEIIASNKELINKMKNLFEKYDKNKNGFITFNEMIEVIKEMKLENIKEELLLISKSEIFNRMDYYNIILLAKDYNNSVNNANNEDNKANI